MTERGSRVVGVGWIAWCALAFVVVLGGGSALFERFVVDPYCVDRCAGEHLAFERFRPGSRGGPGSACMCEGDRAIDTSLADAGTFCAVVAFLGACYAPFLILDLRDRRRRRRAAGR
jgi:hypothetical protein